MFPIGKTYFCPEFYTTFKVVDTYPLKRGDSLAIVIDIIEDDNSEFKNLFSQIEKGEHPQWAGFYSVTVDFLKELTLWEIKT